MLPDFYYRNRSLKMAAPYFSKNAPANAVLSIDFAIHPWNILPFKLCKPAGLSLLFSFSY